MAETKRCTMCGGSGDCVECDGRKVVDCHECGVGTVRCESCDDADGKCWLCDGTGLVPLTDEDRELQGQSVMALSVLPHDSKEK